MGFVYGCSFGDWLGGFVSEFDIWVILMDDFWVECVGFDVLCLSGNVG